jgi:hypothetical protein
MQGTKEKANKKKMPYMGRRPNPRSLLKKRDQNFLTLVCGFNAESRQFL